MFFALAQGCQQQIFRGQNEEEPVVNIVFHNATNPVDPNVYTWANTLFGHAELLVPVDAGDGTTTTLDESDIAYHTERVTSEFKRIIKEGLESKTSLPRDGEGGSSRFETPFSKLPEVLQFNKVKKCREVHCLLLTGTCSRDQKICFLRQVLFQNQTNDTNTTRFTLLIVC
ncbi:unnamed protein product [Ascophyllum nodosum]